MKKRIIIAFSVLVILAAGTLSAIYLVIPNISAASGSVGTETVFSPSMFGDKYTKVVSKLKKAHGSDYQMTTSEPHSNVFFTAKAQSMLRIFI